MTNADGGRRAAFLVYVDLDPVPGTMHTEASAQTVIRSVLYQRMPHYNPRVFLMAEHVLQTERTPELVKAIPNFEGLDVWRFDSIEKLRDFSSKVQYTVDAKGYVTLADLYGFRDLTVGYQALREYAWYNPETSIDQKDDRFFFRFPSIYELKPVKTEG
jgi:hypothetical protein